jgi:hypothetical protein
MKIIPSIEDSKEGLVSDNEPPQFTDNKNDWISSSESKDKDEKNRITKNENKKRYKLQYRLNLKDNSDETDNNSDINSDSMPSLNNRIVSD